MEELNREYFQNRIVAVKLTEVSHTNIIFVCYFNALHRYIGNCALLKCFKMQNEFRSMTFQLVIK